MKAKDYILDPNEAAKRRREYILIFAVAVFFALTTYIEVRLSHLSNKLPLVNSIFFFGLINFNIVLLMVLVLLVFKNISKLFLERRRKLLGSRLKTKLVLAFLSFTIIPTIILFLISSFYINSSFDKWFSIKVQNTLQAALEITQTYYKNTSRVAQHLTVQMANELSENYNEATLRSPKLLKYIERKVETSAVDGIEFYHEPLDSRLVAVTRKNGDEDPDTLIPRLPLDVLKKAFAGQTISQVQHIGGADLIRALAPVKHGQKISGVVAITFIIPLSLINRVDEISSVFQDYKEVNPLKYPIKSTYFVILIMMTLLIIFVSIWIGLYLARELTIPLERLVKATQRISQGNLDFEIINPGNDEIANLTSSFNDMTADIKKHRAELEQTNQLLEEKGAYVEAILNNVAAGVISVDSSGIIRTANPSAAKFLLVQGTELIGKSIEENFNFKPIQDLFIQIKKESAAGHFTPIQKQFIQGDSENPITLLVTASALSSGAVFVIDDMSHLNKVQREAAWREVARRIAHEIKNPLTPIKLSAQRLQKKFASHPSADAVVFKECTDTIIKNVDELRDMVNEFSSFARFPSANPSPNDLNQALKETVVLYEEAHRSIAFVFKPEKRLPALNIDRDLIKRAIINLLDNAVAAFSEQNLNSRHAVKTISIKTHYNEHLNIAVVEVDDNGPGMTDAVKSRLFEPYFSTKSNGTGLGLSIVKRIISDHNGFIRIQSTLNEGTKFTIELPINLLENDYITQQQKNISKEV